MNPRLLFLLFGFLFIQMESFGQRYIYDYDAAGNRTSRTYALFRIRPSENPDTTKVISDDFQASLYPNPVSNNTLLEITRIDPSKEVKALLYDSQGKLMKQRILTKSLNNLNLNHLPAGMYFLQLHYEENLNIIKIIKD